MELDKEAARAFLLETESYVNALAIGLNEGLAQGPTIAEFMVWSLETTSGLAALLRAVIDELP